MTTSASTSSPLNDDNRESDYKIQWSKLPLLLEALTAHHASGEIRGSGAVQELRALLRADAVKAIADVKSEELAKARAEGRADERLAVVTWFRTKGREWIAKGGETKEGLGEIARSLFGGVVRGLADSFADFFERGEHVEPVEPGAKSETETEAAPEVLPSADEDRS